MSGKVTEDILMRVGKGVVRIPRDAENLERINYSVSKKKSNPVPMDPNPVGDESKSSPCQESQENCF